ncbi:hypothetical protein [Burkholderia thailandensis]|uniref:Uncharacterized protein n=1 Tax=Burkholderia thailandensis TaxID=57975 RepID=A0AAW9D766_BURTH|nr:hypothetical protein [Burkholderia thailandensis]AHI65454.1 hypothetical protein BTL_1787 [Burkholderia thailandensis H0587]AIP62584.1 hypothetical protein DR62_3125 [Burkholderia thailandensis]AOI51688.1 hypothetical protein WI24_07660 [Burkholderia thailandensis]AOJ50697.1 hypothetical protein AQ475_07565 [Burkholderia thailandensis]AVR26117.1 hypothetical protein A8H32_14410 [Burkholderia thailandensis]
MNQKLFARPSPTNLSIDSDEVDRLLSGARKRLASHDAAIQCERNKIDGWQHVAKQLQAAVSYLRRAEERHDRLRTISMSDGEYGSEQYWDPSHEEDLKRRETEVLANIASSEQRAQDLEKTVEFIEKDIELLETMRGLQTAAHIREALGVSA